MISYLIRQLHPQQQNYKIFDQRTKRGPNLSGPLLFSIVSLKSSYNIFNPLNNLSHSSTSPVHKAVTVEPTCPSVINVSPQGGL